MAEQSSVFSNQCEQFISALFADYFEASKIVAIRCHLWYIVAMEFNNLIKIAGDEPAFETGLLLAGEVDPTEIESGKFSHALRFTPYAL